MKNLTKEEKKDYLDHPEKIKALKQAGITAIENHHERMHGIAIDRTEITRQFNRLWEVAESYWVFPEAEDYMILLDKVYRKNI